MCIALGLIVGLEESFSVERTSESYISRINVDGNDDVRNGTVSAGALPTHGFDYVKFRVHIALRHDDMHRFFNLHPVSFANLLDRMIFQISDFTVNSI